jgi:S-adenosylmethionine:tRNA ribosyltransferase-isomerase
MVVDRARGTIEHCTVKDLPTFLRPGDLVVANDSRVIPARLRARKASGGEVELLFTARHARHDGRSAREELEAVA